MKRVYFLSFFFGTFTIIGQTVPYSDKDSLTIEMNALMNRSILIEFPDSASFIKSSFLKNCYESSIFKAYLNLINTSKSFEKIEEEFLKYIPKIDNSNIGKKEYITFDTFNVLFQEIEIVDQQHPSSFIQVYAIPSGNQVILAIMRTESSTLQLASSYFLLCIPSIHQLNQ